MASEARREAMGQRAIAYLKEHKAEAERRLRALAGDELAQQAFVNAWRATFDRELAALLLAELTPEEAIGYAFRMGVSSTTPELIHELLHRTAQLAQRMAEDKDSPEAPERAEEVAGVVLAVVGMVAMDMKKSRLDTAAWVRGGGAASN
ncbi:MAG TPA: hypothetical protein VD931_06495 [Baekduia sp.]|nr:hypothetical protein [Baekduia sp.]